MPRIVLLGVNHRSAPLSLREALAFDEGDAGRALERLRADGRLAEALILSTCNRTELYAVGDGPERAAECLREVVCASPRADALAGGEHAYALTDREAARHALRVAAGLDSQILGEAQILCQVKRAVALARQAGALGPWLERMFETAIRAGKRARAETAIGQGAVSVAGAALAMVARGLGGLAGRSFLVVGAGDTGRLAARHIAEQRPSRLLIANRGFERARVLALEAHGEAIPWEALGDALAQADVVLSATRAAGFVIDAALVASARAAVGERPLVIVDLAVPRDVEPAVGALPGVTLHTVDGVRAQVDVDLVQRRGQLPRVEAIVEQELLRFTGWLVARGATPVVRELREHFERVRADELRKSLRDFPAETRPRVERLTQALVNKLLHLPTTRLLATDAATPAGRERLRALKELFGRGAAEGAPGEAEHGR